MIPYTDEHTGLRTYRPSLAPELAPARWPWWIVAFLCGLLLGGLR